MEGVPLTCVTGGADRALDKEAAVGLLSLSVAALLSVTFRVGAGGWGGPVRALARDAAVGANKPEDGVLGLLAGVLELGVLGLFACMAGVLGLPAATDPGVFGRTEEGVVGTPLERELFGVDGTTFGFGKEVDVTDWPVC